MMIKNTSQCDVWRWGLAWWAGLLVREDGGVKKLLGRSLKKLLLNILNTDLSRIYGVWWELFSVRSRHSKIGSECPIKAES